MPVSLPALDALAALYSYPGPRAPANAKHAIEVLGSECPDAVGDLRPLQEHLAAAASTASEELFLRTFELNPVCALDVGWQLYGEQYARGAFLVRVQGLARSAGVDPGTELADHLPNVLRVLARLEGASAGALAVRFALPAVETMRATLRKAAPDNPYCGLLAATARVIARHYGGEVDGE